jgi:hypothetical protein
MCWPSHSSSWRRPDAEPRGPFWRIVGVSYYPIVARTTLRAKGQGTLPEEIRGAAPPGGGRPARRPADRGGHSPASAQGCRLHSGVVLDSGVAGVESARWTLRSRPASVRLARQGRSSLVRYGLSRNRPLDAADPRPNDTWRLPVASKVRSQLPSSDCSRATGVPHSRDPVRR